MSISGKARDLMIIKTIEIENFGKFHDFKLENLSSGVNYIEGENEFGKSTITEFVRRIFYGFPDNRSKLNLYPANCDDKNYGGRLICELSNGEELTIERLGKKERGTLKVTSKLGDELSLSKIMEIDENFYRSIYAITLAELVDGAAFQSDEVSSRLYGVNYATNGKSVSDIKSMLEQKSNLLFLGNGKNQKLFKLNSELERENELLKVLTEKLESSKNIEVEINQLANELEVKQNQQKKLQSRVVLTGNISTLQAKKAKFASDIESIKVDQKVLDNESQINKLVQNTALLTDCQKQINLWQERVNAESVLVDNCDNEFFQVIDNESFRFNLFNYQSQISIAKKLDETNLKLNLAEDLTKEKRQKFLKKLTMAAIGVMLVGILSLTLVSLLWGGITLGFGTLFLAIVSIMNQQIKLSKALNRIDNLAEVQLNFGEFLVQNSLKKSYTLDEAIIEFQAAQQIAKHRENLKHYQNELTSKQVQLQDIEIEVRKIALVLELNVDGKELVNTINECDKLLKNSKVFLAEKIQLEKIIKDESAKLQEFELQLLELDRELAEHKISDIDLTQLNNEISELNNQLAIKRREFELLSKSDELLFAQNRVEILKNELKIGAKEYLKLQVALQFLTSGIEKFENEHQGEIICNASNYFQIITLEKYRNIKKSVINHELLCITANGHERKINELSTGTREQLLLAMRLALIEYIEKNIEGLPVVFDDVLVNFDVARKAKMVEIIEKFAKNRQVLFFKLAN